MNISKETENFATATVEIQKCIERTRIQLARARDEVLGLVESHPENVQLFTPAQDTEALMSTPSNQNERPAHQSTTAQSQLSDLIALIAQQSGVSITEPELLPAEARDSAVKVFREVTQLYKHLADPILYTSMPSASREPKTH